MKKLLFSFLLFVALFTTQVATAQAPKATPEEAVTALLNRIGGNGAADKFKIVIDANLAVLGKDVFVITAQDGKPCIKGNSQLSVATGINWYLNHYAHINLTWNNLTTDLSQVTLPVPENEEKHVCNTTYRYDFNTCTFSYSMAFWTWERWQKEIDWMALHGINAPLNLVGLDVVTRNFLKELGMKDSDIAAYVAGPGFIAWFAMNNLEGWGGTINSASTGVDMSGNPDWWYTRQEQLCKNMLQRMRELGMQPVIPGFSGQIPNSLSNYTISGFSSSDVINGGTWAGGYTRPDILHPNSSSYATLAPIYYKHLEAIMGVSEFYSMDPFHEGGLPSAVTNATCYPPIMAALDTYHNAVKDATKTSYNVSTDDNQAKWIIQYWQNIPQSGAFSSMSNYGDRFIGLDLFSDNIYAGNAAKWRDTGSNCYYKGRPYIYCMLHNFGGRSGLHGRLETTMDGYFQALANNNNCQGIGATPEGTETNPILYDMLFELPWMDVNNRPTADEWLEDYAYSRYGVSAETAPNALAALQNLKESVWNCEVNQQGTSEAVILARPNWTINSVSSWSTAAIYWDTHDVRLAADQLISVADLVTEKGGKSGIANYNYDAIDVIRQAMVDYAAELLPLINAARSNSTEYTRLYKLYLKLMLDLDEMLSYDENFKLERWTSLARNIADEVDGTTTNDRNWLEWNARTQVTVWSKGNTDLHDYSNRCWAGLIKDFHYWRWKYFFENNGGAPNGGWFSGFEYPWTVDFNDVYNYAGDYSQVVIPTDMTATEKAAETFGKYFGRVKGATKNYIFPMGVETNGTKSDVIPEVYRGQTVELPLVIGKNVTVSSVQIDLNGDGAISNTEALTADGMNVTIPANAAIGKTKAIVTFSDGTVITFNLAIIVDITANRTVTAATADKNMGTVAIEGTNELSITNMEAVKITATANTGYNFENWTDAKGNVVSNDNPYIYYGEGDATFTANFIQDKWGVVKCGSDVDNDGNVKDEATIMDDINTNKQFIHNLTFAYYNREAETILETTAAPAQIFNTIPQIIDVPQGASFTVKYDNGNSSGFQYCYFRAYIDLNADGDFDDEGELLKEVGTNGAQNTAVCSNTINVLLPYDMPLGITHMRLRFDSAWNIGEGAKSTSVRPVYEIVLNITDKTDKAAHVTVKTNSKEWGTVEVWTDETPDGSTGTEWDVSSNIPLYLRATKSTPDTEFLGWYDHYGRLLITELEYTMYAREDATYTARFRKFLDIDGWEMEYRTEPGTMVTNKLANGVKPENGKTYYIAAHTLSDGSYYNRYLYDKDGTLATSTSLPTNCVWTCIENSDGTFSFQNESGKYLANNSNYHISIGTTAAKYTFEAPSHEGVTLKNAASYTGGKCMVTSHDGTAFNRNDGIRNDGQWSSDYVFTEVSYPNNVILTKVRKSGNNDLVLPETVEILGEQCTITGFDNGLFANNKDLWSISLPATIETMSNNVVWETSLNGGIAPSTGGDALDSSKSQLIDLGGYALSNDKVWTLDITFETEGKNSLYNKWGTILLSGGENASNNQWLYLSANGSGYLRLPGFSSLYNDSDDAANYFYNLTNGKISTFNISIANQGNGTAIVTVTNSEGESSSSNAVAFNPNGVTKLSSYMTTGVNITSLKITEGPVPDPFEGCSNLDAIAIDGTCANYYVDVKGDLYNSSNYLVCSPAGKAKGADRRALGALIEQMTALTNTVATYNPIGTATEVTLTRTANYAGYIWSNADHNEHNSSTDGGGVAALIDGQANTYMHTNWNNNVTTITDDHFIQVNLGDGNAVSEFKFRYQARSGGNLGDYPKTIKIQGSTDGEKFLDIATVEPRNANGGTIENGAVWTSDVIGNGNEYTYLRFYVTATTSNRTAGGHIYWHMAEFDLYKVSASADVYTYLENAITNVQAAAAYDALVKATRVYDNGTTAEEMQTAKGELETAYNTLADLLKTAVPVTLTTDEESPVLYKIFIKRTADVTVLKYDEATKQVAVVNTADNSSWQAWYFTGSENGVRIHPFNADGKVLAADNTNNAAATVWAADKGEKNFDEWKFVSRADGYYNIQARDESNYFSNNGGTGNKMGFWSKDPGTDTGSLFKFVEATFENNNARYYQLSDVKATMIDGTNIYGGTSVGLYTGGKEYREAYTAAGTIFTAGNSSASDECYAAYKALREAKENLSYNAPDAEKVYYIKSAATKDNTGYCQGTYVYSPNKSVTRTRGNYTGTHNHTHLLFDEMSYIGTKSLAAFQFVATDTQGEYKIKNLHTGLYVKAFTATHMITEAGDAAIVKIAGFADGQVTLKIGNNDPMHAQQDYGVIVQWGAAAGNASLWTIDEITKLEDLTYTTTMSQLGYGTLMLGYDVNVPEGITANVATKVDGKYIIFEKVGDVIPANTAVILKSKEELIDALTLNFEYAGNNAVAPENNMLSGSLYDSAINGVDNKIYQMQANNETVKFYWMYAEYNQAGVLTKPGTDDGGYVKLPANKAYFSMPKSEGASSYSFRFPWEGTTDIEGIVTEDNDALNGTIFDLQGRKIVEIAEPGFYIINGKKVFVEEIK